MERKVEAGLDFRLTLGGGEGAIKIGEEEGKGIRNKEKEKEEEKPEADRNVECKSVDCSLSFQNLQWLLLFPSPVFYSTFPISGLALLSYNFPFIVPLLFHSTLSLSLFFLFAQLPLSAMVENPLYPVKLVSFLTANGGVSSGLKSFHYHLVSFLPKVRNPHDALLYLLRYSGGHVSLFSLSLIVSFFRTFQFAWMPKKRQKIG